MITIAETAPFQRKIAALLSDEERADLIAYLAEHPSGGVLIQGTGGIRKLRWARRGDRRSGYARQFIRRAQPALRNHPARSYTRLISARSFGGDHLHASLPECFGFLNL